MFRVESKRILNWSDVRTVCIQNDYYTHGTIGDYEEMLGRVQRLEEVTDYDLQRIALDIFEHTDVDSICELGGVDRAGAYASILFNLTEEVHTIYDVKEV